MIDAFRNTGSLLAAGAFFLAAIISGCENPGAIGEGIADSGADVVVDTFLVDNVTVNNHEWYSGDYTFFSAGQVSDPAFGMVSATGMIKPTLPSGDNSVDTDATMLMRLILDGSEAYGDSLAGQSFDIYEIEELWRGRAWMLQEDVQLSENPIGSFTIEDEDSLDVPLSSNWLSTYREYSESEEAEADSAYQYEQYGLALVPTNSNKVIALNSRSTRFVVQNPESDTFSVSATEWAYSLNRSGEGNLPENTVPLHSTYESIGSIDFNISGQDVPSIGISRAELVLYENAEALEGINRPSTSNALLYITDPEGTPENIALGNPVAQGRYSSSDRSFRFEVTNIVQNIIVNGLPEDQEFFITLPNQGIVRSTLIHTEDAPAERTPKFIITSLNSSDS